MADLSRYEQRGQDWYASDERGVKGGSKSNGWEANPVTDKQLENRRT